MFGRSPIIQLTTYLQIYLLVSSFNTQSLNILARDLEMVREKSLLKEFETYRAHKGQRLKVFRLEAMRAGFRNAWANKDHATIIEVAKKVPEEALQEDEKLLLWYDQALTLSEVDG